MTREEAKKIFLNRGYVEVDGGTIYDADKWRQSCAVISEWLIEQEPKGHWITIDYQHGLYECSECHTKGYVDTEMYKPTWVACPRCGARMEGKE